MKRVVPRLQGPAKQLAKGELIGRRCKVASANDAGIVGMEGDVIDETLHTIVLRKDGPGGRHVRLAKAGAVFSFRGNQGDWIDIDGRAIQFRPEDRVKKVK